MPKPFSRPSVSLATDVKREYKTVPFSALKSGDTVPGYGTVEQVDIYPEEVVVLWKNGTRSVLAHADQITAFVKV